MENKTSIKELNEDFNGEVLSVFKLKTPMKSNRGFKTSPLIELDLELGNLPILSITKRYDEIEPFIKVKNNNIKN